MKKIAKIVSLVLALVMLLAVTAVAEGEAPAGTTLSDQNNKIVVYGFDGATAVIEGNEDEFFKFTYTSSALKEGNQYLVMVLPSEDGTAPEPNDGNILYINQTAAKKNADGDVFVEFETIYPINPADSVIVLYGIGADETAKEIVAAIIEAKYVLGDVNGDGEITVPDAILILRHAAELTTLSGSEALAADVNGDDEISVPDAIRILRFVAELSDVL